MSKINREKVIAWKSKDSHILKAFNGKFLTQKYNNLYSKKTERLWNILKRNKLTTNLFLKHNLINHIYSFFIAHFSMWLVTFIIIVSFDIVVPLVLTSTLRTTTEFTACQFLFATRASIGSAPGGSKK